MVLAALKRANPKLSELEPDAIGTYLETLDPDQVEGIANNVKGVLHEMEYVALENEDGDAVQAALFTDTNHPGTDVILQNSETGERLEIQLKATDQESYVLEWMEKHPDGEIVVTEELAAAMDLESSGFSNEGLNVRVSDFLDKLVELDEQSGLWSYFPALPALSIAICSYFLLRRLQAGLITQEEFQALFLRMSGFQIGKFALISLLMLIPVVNVATGAYLVARLLYSGARFFKSSKGEFIGLT